MNRDTAQFFTGIEVENLITKGLKTLFVVGDQTYENICKQFNMNNCKAIYFGANQSHEFDFKFRVNLINELIAKFNCFVVLDLDVSDYNKLLKSNLGNNPKFVPVISIKLPDIKNIGYNAIIKIDDIGFNKTNPGVWTHKIQDLTTLDSYTHWNEYSNDTQLKG